REIWRRRAQTFARTIHFARVDRNRQVAQRVIPAGFVEVRAMVKHTSSMADICPPTAWTRIVRARGLQADETQDARRTLIEIYDRPLLRLFQKRLPHRLHDAQDWKQDFLLSHFQTGKVFEHAAPS